MSAVTEGAKPYYFVPAPSRHPASLAFGMLLIIFGASQWINGHALPLLMAVGALGVLIVVSRQGAFGALAEPA